MGTIVSIIFDPVFWAIAFLFCTAMMFKERYKIWSWVGIAIAVACMAALIAQKMRWIN